MSLENKDLLRGIKILDLADQKAAFCSKLMADMGADVIKIEKQEGDASRRVGPFLHDSPNPEESLFFFYNNTNKRGITLNLESQSGRNIFEKLIERTDVVLETFPPGYLDGIGLVRDAQFLQRGLARPGRGHVLVWMVA